MPEASPVGDGEPGRLRITDERALPYPVVARLVVLQSEVRRVVAQRQEKMVVPVVPRAVKRTGFVAAEIGHDSPLEAVWLR